jgi:TolB-like protein
MHLDYSMKLSKSLIAIALLVFTGFVSRNWAVQAEFTKTKIAILDFSLQGEGLDADMGKIVAEWMITALVKDGRFDVVERRLLESIIEEHKLVMTGVVDANSAEELGHLLGVKVIVTGSLMKYQSIMEVNARIIDVKNASIIAAESVQSTNAITLEDLVKKMSDKIIRDFPLEGYVVSCDGDTIMLDIGLNSGVKPGMQFSVYSEGQIIKHPRTGEVLDIERVQSAIVEIETVRQKLSTARIVSRFEGKEVEYGQHVSSLRDSDAATQPPQKPTVSAQSKAPQVTQPAPRAPVVQAPPPVPTSQNPQQVHAAPAAPVKSNPLHDRIRSSVSSTKTRAIREVAKMRYIDQATYDLLEQELLKGYMRAEKDKKLIDGLSWCCTILGRSGNSKYQQTLLTVSTGTPHSKLRGYAQSGLESLEKNRR